MFKLIRLINKAGEQQRQTDGQRYSCGRCNRSVFIDRKNCECAATEIPGLSAVNYPDNRCLRPQPSYGPWRRPEAILEVSMDLSAPFQKGVAEGLPKAPITFDRCHLTLLVNDVKNVVCRSEALFKAMCRIFPKKNLNVGEQELINLLKNRNFKTTTTCQPLPAYQNSYSDIKNNMHLATESALPLMVKAVAHKPAEHPFPAMNWVGCVGQILSAWVHCSELSEFQRA